ncbi:MAG: IS630 family transposase [Rhodothermaceae bacterium]|nr:IS630 family transposase [Rhodothermaceae bacterium]
MTATQSNRTNRTGARDGRSLDRRAMEQLRLRAVERVEAGERVTDVARTLGFDRAVVNRWVLKARKEGIEALHATVAPGRTPVLDDAQVEFLRFLILEIDPAFWGFESRLWTRAMVVALIERVFGVRLSVESVGRIMRERMGLSPQRPVRRAYEADDEQVRRWVEEAYPAIRARAKERGARIYFADEAQVRSDDHSGRTWAPRGETPVVGATGQRFSINLVSAISPEGELCWMRVEGRMNAQKFIDFLAALIRGRRRPVFVIVDNHPSHKAKAVAKFVEANKERLELYFLPPYSPELNPDEQVWNHLKNHTIGKRGFYVATQLWQMVSEHLEWMGGVRKLIRAFFSEPRCRYAKA